MTFGRDYVLDLIAEDFHTPRGGSLVHGIHDGMVDGFALFKCPVEFDFSNFGTQRRLGQLGGGKGVVFNPVTCRFSIDHLQIKNAIDRNGNVILGEACLARHINCNFFKGVLVSHTIDKRDEDMKAGVQTAGILAQPFDDELAPLRDNVQLLLYIRKCKVLIFEEKLQKCSLPLP